jgi:hypothetical protein
MAGGRSAVHVASSGNGREPAEGAGSAEIAGKGVKRYVS